MNTVERIRAHKLPIEAEEQSHRRQLEALHSRLGKPALQSRVAELQAMVRMAVDRQPDPSLDHVDPNNMRRMHQYLEFQRKGVTELTKVLKKDLHDMDIVLKGLRAPPNQ